MQLGSCLFTIENQNDGDVLCVVMKPDPAVVQETIDRGVRVIRSADPMELSRIARERSDFRCKFCDYQERCWATPERPGLPAEAPTWWKG
jgi:hypothetical protein